MNIILFLYNYFVPPPYCHNNNNNKHLNDTIDISLFIKFENNQIPS